MRATVWHGRRDVRVETVPDPVIKEANDALVRITSTGLCGSDLHLYEVLTPFMTPGDILGHEPMGIVEEVGPEVPGLRPGDRVVIPFQIACGHCALCADGLPTQCETTQDRDEDLLDAVRDATRGRGPDAVIDAVGTEAHGGQAGAAVQRMAGMLPSAWAERLMQHVGVDRLSALQPAIGMVRRGGTISISGVYGGMTDPLPLLTLFDKQVRLRMGQANVRRWSDEIIPLLTDEDPLGVDDFASHHPSPAEAPRAYERFQKKSDGATKILLKP